VSWKATPDFSSVSREPATVTTDPTPAADIERLTRRLEQLARAGDAPSRTAAAFIAELLRRKRARLAPALAPVRALPRSVRTHRR